MNRTFRVTRCACLLALAAVAGPVPAPAQEETPVDTAVTGPPGAAVEADTVGFGACPERLDGASDAPGVAWADTTAAADGLATSLGVEALDAVPGDRLLRRGDRSVAAGHHTSAYVAYAAAARAGAGYEGLWKAARAAVDVGQELSGDEARDWFGVAEAYGRRAVESRPGSPEGHLQLAQALGLVALDADVRERVRLSEEIRGEARASIEADSSYAGGWHVLGRWHRGVMELSGAGRFFARTFLGGEVLGEASWEGATRSLERAAELEPGRIVHHLELARVHRDQDRLDAARRELRQVLALAPRDYRDCVYRQEARELLEEMGAG